MMDVPYQYSRICGRVRAYQIGNTNAFRSSNTGIDGNYVDGASLTHGLPTRRHIWTFAAGHCPCTNNENATPTPGFVETDYFCESGTQTDVLSTSTFFSVDALWDGDADDCCSFNNPPWFDKQFSQPTTDDIEMRVCRMMPVMKMLPLRL